MATVSSRRPPRKVVYPTSDGKPMAETDDHHDLMVELIETQKAHFASEPNIYVSGNLLMYYVRGNPRRHVSPDVFVVHGVKKKSRLKYYATWEQQGKGPDFVVEMTSRSTRKEDTEKKFRLYQDVLHVAEYFLFDPFAEYLKPPLQGYRLKRGRYVRIKSVGGRLPSEVTGLHLERHGEELRLYDPTHKLWLPNPEETKAKLEASEAENARLRQELEALRRASGQS